MPEQKIPRYMIDDLSRFIAEKYPVDLPNSLLIAQSFILRYPDYGNKYGLSIISRAIEEGITEGLFQN